MSALRLVLAGAGSATSDPESSHLAPAGKRSRHVFDGIVSDKTFRKATECRRFQKIVLLLNESKRVNVLKFTKTAVVRPCCSFQTRKGPGHVQACRTFRSFRSRLPRLPAAGSGAPSLFPPLQEIPSPAVISAVNIFNTSITRPRRNSWYLRTSSAARLCGEAYLMCGHFTAN